MFYVFYYTEKSQKKKKTRKVFVLVHHCMVLWGAGLWICTFIVDLGPAALSDADLDQDPAVYIRVLIPIRF